MRILVIEDDASIAGLLADLLAGEGHAVTRVAEPDAGLALARARPWDVCLTDGYWAEATAGTRAYLAARAARCPVVLLSARAWARVARAADLGVAALVPKPPASGRGRRRGRCHVADRNVHPQRRGRLGDRHLARRLVRAVRHLASSVIWRGRHLARGGASRTTNRHLVADIMFG